MGTLWWMSVANWALEAMALLMTTIGALLLVLTFRQIPPLAKQMNTPEGERLFTRHYTRMLLAVGVVALSLVVQCIAMFFS